MTKKEAIKHLQDDLALSVGNELFVPYGKVTAFREAINMAIASLSEPEESVSEPKEADAPLTLEELKAMYAANDTAIYVVYGKCDFPAILGCYGEELVAIWNALGYETGLFAGDYGKKWLAYRNNPYANGNASQKVAGAVNPMEAIIPLTLKELKTMYDADDSAVYVAHENRKFPAILDFYGGELVAVWSVLGHKNGLFEGDYGETWLAYRNRPSNNISAEPFFCPEIVMREPEHVFYELDGEPILYVCTDTNGVRCLCSCYQMSRNWIVGQVEEKTLIDMIDDRITIREAFEHCGTKLCVSWDGNDFVFAPGIPSDALPKAGARLELEWEKTGEYRKMLAEKMVD